MDVIRTGRSEALLKAPLLALQQAGLHQAEARYQLVQAQLGNHVMPKVCPRGDPYLLLAGMPNLVITHGIWLTGEPVVSQLRQLLSRVDAWASHYPEQAQPIRLLALWLDKLLRLDPSRLAEEGGHSVLHLSALELRCLGRLDSPWRDWAEGRLVALMPSSDEICSAIHLALHVFSRELSVSKGLAWLLAQVEAVAVRENAVLLYGILAFPGQEQGRHIHFNELESKQE